ncbi:MAG: hypothetical protein AAF962_26250 [Actinomycetota bacterium]
MRLIPDRLGANTLKGVSGRVWGVRANVMDDVVAAYGTVRSMWWFGRSMSRYDKIMAEWGPIRTHLVVTTLAMVSGCRYHTVGHGSAFQLHYFAAAEAAGHDWVFPLTDDDLLALVGADADTIVSVLDDALTEAGLPDEVPWLSRLLRVRETGKATDADDKRLRHLVKMFDRLIVVAKAASTEPDEAHDPINLDHELRDRYARARAAAS